MAKENWLLDKLQVGIGQTSEANTSRYVHEVICHCFNWPFEAIFPQASKRGFIDYILKHENGTHFHVEVKPFGARLYEEMILKYLRSRANNFHIGILTNLREWQIFAAGRSVKKLTGVTSYRIHQIEINRRAHINELANLVGYHTSSDLLGLFELFSQNKEILKYLLTRDEFIIRAIRNRLKKLAPDARMPNYNSLERHMRQLVKNSDRLELDAFMTRQLKLAVQSSDVAEAARQQFVKLCGVSAGQRRVQALIRQIILSS